MTNVVENQIIQMISSSNLANQICYMRYIVIEAKRIFGSPKSLARKMAPGTKATVPATQQYTVYSYYVIMSTYRDMCICACLGPIFPTLHAHQFMHVVWTYCYCTRVASK